MATVYYTLGSTTATTNEYWWTRWANTTTTSTAVNNKVWLSWVSSDEPISAMVRYETVQPEQRVHATFADPSMERRIREINEASERAAKKAADASVRARALLIATLSLEQRAEFERNGFFVVHGRNARYRIRQARSANIDVVKRDGFVSHRLCAHPGEWVPDFDTMLAQKLMLEDNEESFLRVANRHSAFEGRDSAVLPALS